MLDRSKFSIFLFRAGFIFVPCITLVFIHAPSWSIVKNIRLCFICIHEKTILNNHD